MELYHTEMPLRNIEFIVSFFFICISVCCSNKACLKIWILAGCCACFTRHKHCKLTCLHYGPPGVWNRMDLGAISSSITLVSPQLPLPITPCPQNREIHTKSRSSLSSAHFRYVAHICALQRTSSLDLSVLARAKVRYTKQKRAAESKRSLQLHAAAEQ